MQAVIVMANAQSMGAAAWSEADWDRLDRATRRAALARRDPLPALVRAARGVMRTFTSSFFIVSRFLPRAKRDQVELIYAAVRYPDEVVDTLSLTAPERHARLDRWAADYDRALEMPTPAGALAAGVPCFVAGFAEVVRRNRIPPEHYRAFLDAMRFDIEPRPFRDLADLIDTYVYGSAVVVGYFLTHVYGTGGPGGMPRALEVARDLGVALQLTNTVRDLAEDWRRGRLYLPLDRLAAEGLAAETAFEPDRQAALARVVRGVAEVAEEGYRRAARNLDAFAPDSRAAVGACIEVYGRLNRLILERPAEPDHRASVSLRAKWRVLPPSKYWRVPWAYLVR